MAGQLGLYMSFVSRCEAGDRSLDVVELAAFCQVYGLDLADFLKDAGLAD